MAVGADAEEVIFTGSGLIGKRHRPKSTMIRASAGESDIRLNHHREFWAHQIGVEYA